MAAHDIAIDHLTIEELIALGDRVNERIKYLERIHVFDAMQRYNIGTHVRFYPGRYGPQTGTLTKFNQKSVTILGDDHRQWRVPPDIIEPLDDAGEAGADRSRSGK